MGLGSSFYYDLVQQFLLKILSRLQVKRTVYALFNAGLSHTCLLSPLDVYS